jgi:hypothetical protein
MLRVSLLSSCLIFIMMSGYPGIIIIKGTEQTIEEKCDCVSPSHCADGGGVIKPRQDEVRRFD